jgi:hypothetical protein
MVVSRVLCSHLQCVPEAGDLPLLLLTRAAVSSQLIMQAVLQRRKLLPLLIDLPRLVQNDLTHHGHIQRSVFSGFPMGTP